MICLAYPRQSDVNCDPIVNEQRQDDIGAVERKRSGTRRKWQKIRNPTITIGSSSMCLIRGHSIAESEAWSKMRSKVSSSTVSEGNMKHAGFPAFVGKDFSREQTHEERREDMKKIGRIRRARQPMCSRRQTFGEDCF